MSASLVARAINAGRLAFGVGMMVVPEKVMGAWIGEAEAARPAMKMVVRSFGMREIVLGGLGLHVADRPGVGPRTIQTLALCDLVDAGVTVASRRDLPSSALPIMLGVAGGAAAAQTWAARELA
jgi:hypothetical protein